MEAHEALKMAMAAQRQEGKMCRILQRGCLDPSIGTGFPWENERAPGGRNSTEKSKELNLPFLKEPKMGPVRR